jgi:single-stranded-DNA-specific exonuclease
MLQSPDMPKSYKLKTAPISENPDGNLLDRLLAVRGIGADDVVERDLFLDPNFETGLHDPFLLKDMDRTVDRITKAIRNGEHILIYSDYDADGLPGASIFHDFFRTISYPRVSFFQPDRHVDGFGVHAHILDEYLGKTASGVEAVDAQGQPLPPATLMISIDCGIADVEPVRILTEGTNGHTNNGGKLDIIITDHHLPGPVLPAAYAIVNPKREDCEYPEKMLCGSGVAYKIICALVSKMDDTAAFPSGYTKWLLDLVGIATMSDMVPLLGENRLLAYYGLIVLRKTKRVGIISLCRTNMLDPRNITEEDIAFTLAPRINVASRLAHPKMAFDLLTSSSFDEAMRIAKDLNNINNRRKTMVAGIMKQAHAQMRERIGQRNGAANNAATNTEGDAPILVIGNPDWKPPVLGLVATQLIKAYGKPTFVWGRDDSGAYKGSARSTASIDIVKLMYAVPDEVFINKGGHAQSGGFCVHPDHIFGFDAAMQDAYEKTYGADNRSAAGEAGSGYDELSRNVIVDDTMTAGKAGITKCYEVDAIIDIADVNDRTFSMIEKLSPYGVGNEKPLFAIRNFNIKNARMFGKSGEHLELEHAGAGDGTGYGAVKAIQFFFGDSGARDDDQPTADPLAALKKNQHKAIIGHIEKNQFRGANEIRVRIVDVV